MTENSTIRSFFSKKTTPFLLLLSSLLTFLIVACRPEIVANDKLNGDWSLQSINNKPIAKGDYETLHFEKNASGGDIILTMHLEGKDTICAGKYDVLKILPSRLHFQRTNLLVIYMKQKCLKS